MFGWLRRKEKISDTWRWLSALAFAGVIAINAIAATTTLLGGMSTGEVSDTHANLFAPAGFTFSIWSLIYLLLIVFLARSWRVWQPAEPRIAIGSHNYVLKLFTVTSLANILWIIAWQYQVFWLSVVFMIVLLVTLAEIHRTVSAVRLSMGDVVAVRAPFSIYFGWVTVALIANITTWLVAAGWGGWGVSDEAWTVIMLLIGSTVLVSVGAYRRDWLYTAVGLWAYFGILAEHMSVDGHESQYGGVIVTIAVLLPIIAAATVVIAVWRVDTSQTIIDRIWTRLNLR